MKKILWLAGLFTFLAIALSVQPARAHESVTIGENEIVAGCVTEPPLAGQMNGVELHVSKTSTGPGRGYYVADCDRVLWRSGQYT
jgi:hypothetical protein